MKQLKIRSIMIIAVLVFTALKSHGQSAMPDALSTGSLKEQMNYLEEHTKIYENYRAIREDMFQKVKVNISDTLLSVKNRIAGLNKTTSALNQRIDSLKTKLDLTKTGLDEITRTKDSIKVAGLEINKSSYNKIMWTILVILLVALISGFVAFKRNLMTLLNTRKDFQELKTEFEAYRKTSREAREKLTMDHFKELKKLRGE
jgi:predicted small metal-binding protein